MILSVIVPCHDIARYLDRCLRSLRDQDLGAEEYEVIVIDDGSTDDSLRIAREHEASDPRITVHSQSNKGLSAARNAGLDRATGAYVYFVDGDDYVAGGALRSAVDAAREHSLDLGFVGLRRVQPDEDVDTFRPATDVASTSSITNGMEYTVEHLVYPASACMYLIDRSFLDRAGVRFEAGRLFEDQLFTAELLAVAQRVASVDLDIYRYVQRPGSITNDPEPEHVRRILGDFEHVVAGLDELRQRTAATGTATPAFLDRLTTMQEIIIFLLIMRIIRSRIPLWPVLPDTLADLRSHGYYPLKKFPGREHRGLKYRVATTVVNHTLLLYPTALAYRVVFARWIGTAARRPST